MSTLVVVVRRGHEHYDDNHEHGLTFLLQIIP